MLSGENFIVIRMNGAAPISLDVERYSLFKNSVKSVQIKENSESNLDEGYTDSQRITIRITEKLPFKVNRVISDSVISKKDEDRVNFYPLKSTISSYAKYIWAIAFCLIGFSVRSQHVSSGYEVRYFSKDERQMEKQILRERLQYLVLTNV